MLSLIIPTYNSRDTIKDCINSILQLNHIKYEIIIIDDGSNDGTSNINDKYAAKHNNIISLHQKHGGVSKARNLGILHSSGTWASFIDSDDTVNASNLEKIYKLYANNSNGMIVSNINVYGKKFGIQSKDKISNTKKYVDDNYPLTSLVVKDNAGKMYNLNVIKKYNLHYIKHLNNGEDYTFTMMFLMQTHKHIVQTHISYYNYNINPNSSVRSYDKDRLKNNLIKFHFIKKLYNHFNLSTKALNWIKIEMARDILFNYLAYCHCPLWHKINSLFLLRNKVYKYNLLPNKDFRYKYIKCYLLRIFMSPSNKWLLFILMEAIIIRQQIKSKFRKAFKK